MKKIFTLCVVLCMSYLSMGATNLKHEFRATWLATVSGIDWPKTKATNDATREQQKQELIDILDKMKAGNLNAVCFQVRSLCDAMYQSSYEPWSIALTGTRGKDPGYDPLQFAIDEAHKRGMELHVWVNPFRVTSAGTLDANDLVKKNAGQWIIQYNNGSFTGEIIDPGYPEAREYVLNVLMEIISNYDIDGIVMDDYFYPYGGTTTEDAASKALHKPANVVDVNKDGKTDDDWRRSNVNVFLLEFYNRIQTTKPWVRLGMGTFGIWTTQTKVAQAYGISLPSGISGLDDYDEQACNPVEWVKKGYVDYINPQLYWPTTSTGQNYNKLCQWWAKDVCEHFSNQLTNGKKVHFFSSQSISSNRSLTEIQAQVDANRSNLSSGYTGSVFFDTDAYLTMDKDLMTSRFATNALTPPMDWKSNTALAAPTNLTVSGSTLSWQHATAERFTVYVYPKGTAWSTAKNDPAYLQGVIYGNTMDISGIDTNMNDIAVCAYDRFSVEHTAAVYSNDSGAGTTPNPETIIWELNGGEVNTVTVEVPSLTTLEAQFKNDYNSYFGASVATTREITNFLYYGSKEEGGSNLVYNMMNDPASDWTWLRDYIISKSASNTTIQTALLAGTDAHWRYSIVAFLTASAGTNSTYTVDFSIAGQPSKWGTAYQIAHGAVLLPTYVTSAYTLPTPVHPSGYEFLGWYDNAEFAGSPLTTIPANWTGTLYAQWRENAPTIDPTWQILYTSTNGNIVTPNKTGVFGANIVSNEYKDGQGVITFDGPVTSIGEKAFYQCKSLASITIPNSVTSIGNSAFSSCSSLTSVTIGNSVTSIGEDAFYDCSSLTSVTINSDAIVNKAYSYNYSILNIFGSQVTEYIIGDEVTSIGEYAFYECSSLTSITIPNSVTSIGKWTFSWCSSLTSITIPNSVTSIGSPAFNGCSSLTSVTINSNDIVSREYTYSSNIGTIFGSQVTEYVIGNSVTSIGKYAFYKCSSLASITIPNSVTSIGEDAFYNCSSLTSITIPNSVTSIGSSAFRDCSSLTSVTIPENVTSIGDRAFYNCSSLTSITIPNSVTSIGYHAFYNCAFTKDNFINNSTLDAEKENYWGARVGDTEIDGLLIKDDTILVACRPHLTSVTIPNSVTSIGSSAFYGCSSLTSVTIPNSVTSIGEDAFYNCSSLTSVTIPNSVTSIGYDAFDGTAIYKDGSNWENDVLYIDNCLIEAKTSISGAYTIKDNTRLIADFAFYNCSSLTSVTIPNSVTSIGGGVFCGCKNLTNAVLSENMTSLPNNKRSDYTLGFFEGCSSLTSVTIPNSVTSIGEDAFSGCTSLTSITIPNSVTSIGSSAFSGCSSLTSITIPNSVTSIGEDAFYYCSSLTSITIPNSVTSIGSSAFRDCSSLTSITIPESVTSIGNYAFYYCSSLTSITIPNSVTSIGYDAFGNCIFTKDNFVNNSSLDAEENDFWGASIGNTEIDGLLIRNDTVIDCRKYVTSVTIPNSVTSIGSSAFYYCSSLTSITIPNSVTSIGNYAFHDCSSLTSITIPNSVTNIGKSTFSYCSSLTSITIPESVTSIGEDAFYNCSSLTSITIPNSVTSIGNYAFHDCSSLTSIYLPYDIPIANQSSFDDSHFEKVKLYVPLEAYEAYKADDVWGKFKNILYINNFYENNIRYSYIMDGEVLSASLLTEENFNKFTPISLIGSQNWHYDSKYGAKMSGYSDATQTTYSNEDWLISPTMDLSKHSSATLTFSHAFGPKASVPTTATQKAQYTCWISNDFNGDVTTATWTELPITYGTSAWNFITTTVDIPAENLKENCHIAWKYVCTTSSATWEIKSVEIGGSYTKPAVKVIAKNDKYSNDVVIPSVVTHNYADYSVETIAANAFSSCPSLTSITIGNNVKSIENYAFESCSSLTSVMLGGKIETIGENAFSSCTALNEITLPTSVKSIGENAFAGCTKLYDIYCFAMEPPTAYESSFANYNAFLHVPCDNQRVYLLDVIFGNFKFIECIEAETTPTDTIVVTPSFNDAEFIWPTNSSADSYTLAISKDGEVFCTLTFNANGQLTGIAFAPSRNGQHNAPAAAQTANGFAFTVTGLDEGANYTYDLLIQDRSGNTLQSYSGEFRTQSTNDRTVTVEYDAAQGQVTGAGTYLVGDTVTLTAIPNYGYHFVQWSDGNTDNPRTLVLTQDTILTAEFALTISGQCGDNLYWAYDEASKTIAITGSGDMYDYTKDTQPWLLFQDQIAEVTTSNTTTSIGDWAFDDCSGLTSVTIGNSVTSIGEQAFNGCSSLTSITIPNSVTSIGEGAFEYCSSLDTIHVEATTPPALEDSTVFMNTPSPVCVIPCGTLATYQSSDWANQVGSFVEDCPPASAAITYVLNGGVVSAELPTYLTSSYTLPTPTREGYIFRGWYDNPQGIGDCLSTLPAGYEGTIYAYWTKEPTDALNPFAYALSSELSQDNSQLLINYSLNARAMDVQIVIMDGETAVKTIACDGLSKGSHSIAIPTAGLPEHKQLTWKVEVKGAEVTEPTEYAVNYSFYHPSAVDIDNNPENPTFGMILTNEGMHKVKDINGYLSTGYGAGIYAFNPAFEPMPNGSNPGYNGGIEFTNGRADDTTRIAYSPRRIRISEDGRIFVTSLNTDGNYLWEVNPENMNEWTSVFQGTLNDQRELVDAAGNFIAAPNAGFDVKGSGENLQLMMYSFNLRGITSVAMDGLRCDEYNLGTATTWTTAPSKSLVDCKYITTYIGTQVEYDNEGGIWIASYRGTATNDSPGLVHINAEGVEDCKLLWSNLCRAGIRFNNDFTKLVVAGNNGSANKATIYAVSKDANGAPVLTEEWVIDATYILGRSLNDFAFDYAGNLYACGHSTDNGEKIVAWAMPRSADEVITTPAASKYNFTYSDAITYELNSGITNDHGWMSKDDMYHELLVDINAIIPTTRVDVDTVTLAYDKTKNIQKGIPTYWDDLSSLLIHSDFLSKWGWLINYMDSACASESKYLPSTLSVYLRYNLSAFFFEKEYTSWPQTPDYSKYGLYPYYQPAWQHAYDNPTNPTEEFILNAPYREGYTFAGWYTNADLSGEKITIVEAETNDTLYAKWIENSLVESTWKVLYTSTNGGIVAPNAIDVFGANIVSNTYENGVGTITFDGPVTSIGTAAFHDCLTLKSITIPNSVNSIGVQAFRDCSAIDSLTIPENVNSISGWAFMDCSSLLSIVVAQENMTYDSRENCNAIIETATNTLIVGCKKTIIPNGVATIGEHAFRISSLAFITIPNSVTNIERLAFCGSSIDTIYVEATTPPALADSTVFMYTPSPVCVIPCGTKEAYEASDWANYMGEFIEEGCPTVQMCGDDLYWEYADGLLTITGTGDMYDYADDKTGPAPWYDVRGSITTINMPNEMTKIGDYAFYKCTEVTSINMPTTLTAIGEKAFAQDTKLACEIILPASMTTIASRAFFNCQAVTAFHLEATTPPTIPNDAFERTTAPIHVPCGYGHVYGRHAQWGMLNLEMCELLQYNVYYYPIDGHTARAVTYHSNPTDTIVIPSAVVIDGMPRTVTEVADFAFADCKDIPAIIFNEGLEYIGERAFVRCYGLQGTIVLPATLETIGERAFSYCDNVEKYLIQAMTPPALGDGAFTCANHDALFYVSCEVMDDYKVATNWSSLKSRLRDACLNIYHYNTALGANGVHATEDTLVASIYYRRKFTPYRWETLYLPFEVDRVTVLEEGLEYDLTAWDIVYGGHYFLAKPDGMLNKEILFGFTDELESHTPYIIQFSDAYYTDKLITFYGKESWNKLSTSFEVLSSSAWMQIAGNTTLQDQLLEKPVYMLRSGLDFILQKTTTTLHPFECYVMPYATPSGAPARMNVRMRDDVATAVESVKGNESHLTYTVDGYTLTVYPQGQAFSIYSLNGALIYSCEAGKEAVDCELNSGCYLLHAGTEAHKIML